MQGELKEQHMDDAKLDEMRMAAVRRLSLEPGACSREGCNETLICVMLERWDGEGDIPPPRFACPEHDVWLGHCFDSGVVACFASQLRGIVGSEGPKQATTDSGDKNNKRYSEGLYEGCLRDPSDPAWRWLPEHLRPAAARAGFCVRHPYVYPDKLVGPWRSRAWATDGHNIIRIGDAADIPGIVDRFGIKVTPESSLPRVLAEHQLPEERLDTVLRLLAEKDYRELPKTKPVGLGEFWNEHVAFGEAVMAPLALSMVEEMFPGCSWRATGRVEPVFAVLDGEVVAAVMPVDVEGAERLRREDAEGECDSDEEATSCMAN